MENHANECKNDIFQRLRDQVNFSIHVKDGRKWPLIEKKISKLIVQSFELNETIFY